MKQKLGSRKMIKNICIIYFALILAGFLMMCFVHLLPTKIMDKHVAESKGVFEQEGVYPQLMAGHLDARLDNWTDAIMLLVAAYDGEGTAFTESMRNGYWRVNGKNPAESLVELYSGGKEGSSVVSYARYWHGYEIFLKPMLLFFNYQEIRYVMVAVQICLFGVVIVLFTLRNMIKEMIPLILTYLFLNPAVLLLSMQMSQIWILVLIQFIFILYFDKAYQSNKNIWINHFFMIGCLTSFFDFLSYPLVTLGITGTFLICRNLDKIQKQLVSFLKISVAWGCGYVFMWIGKWVLGSMILKRNIIKDAVSVFRTRAGYETASEEFTYFDVLSRNLSVRKDFLYAILILMVVCMIFGIHHKVKLQLNHLFFIIFALFPFGWYLIATNHSYIHYWFTYREMAITVYALSLMGTSVFIKEKTQYESRNTCRRLRQPHQRREPPHTEANGGNRGEADFMAHNEIIFFLRIPGIYHLCRLQAACHQGMVCGLLPVQQRYHD